MEITLIKTRKSHSEKTLGKECKNKIQNSPILILLDMRWGREIPLLVFKTLLFYSRTLNSIPDIKLALTL